MAGVLTNRPGHSQAWRLRPVHGVDRAKVKASDVLFFWACQRRSRSCASVKGRRGKPGDLAPACRGVPIPRRPCHSPYAPAWEAAPVAERVGPQLSRLLALRRQPPRMWMWIRSERICRPAPPVVQERRERAARRLCGGRRGRASENGMDRARLTTAGQRSPSSNMVLRREAICATARGPACFPRPKVCRCLRLQTTPLTPPSGGPRAPAAMLDESCAATFCSFLV